MTPSQIREAYRIAAKKQETRMAIMREALDLGEKMVQCFGQPAFATLSFLEGFDPLFHYSSGRWLLTGKVPLDARIDVSRAPMAAGWKMGELLMMAPVMTQDTGRIYRTPCANTENRRKMASGYRGGILAFEGSAAWAAAVSGLNGMYDQFISSALVYLMAVDKGLTLLEAEVRDSPPGSLNDKEARFRFRVGDRVNFLLWMAEANERPADEGTLIVVSTANEAIGFATIEAVNA